MPLLIYICIRKHKQLEKAHMSWWKIRFLIASLSNTHGMQHRWRASYSRIHKW